MSEGRHGSAPDLWPATVADLEEEQRRLAAMAPPPWIPAPGTPSLRLAGCFVCFSPQPRLPGDSSAQQNSELALGRAGDRAWAAAVLLEGARLVASTTVKGEARAAYDPGHLALREGPLLEAAIRQLPRPDVLVVNATGRDHPRRAGLALHLGARLDLPSVGVTNRLLVASPAWPLDRAGAWTHFRLHGETVGAWLRVRRGVRPLAIHAAWRTDVSTALAVVRLTVGRARTPEPIRLARRAAREARQGELRRQEGVEP